MSADNPTICFCLNVKKNAIIEAVQKGAQTVNDVRKATRACCGCQSCYADIEVLIDAYALKPTAPAETQEKPTDA